MVSVIFYKTSTCGYCQPIQTVVNNLKRKYEDNENVLFTELIVDKDSSALASAKEWGVNAVPTIIFIVNQEEQERLIGNITQQKIIDGIERNL